MQRVDDFDALDDFAAESESPAVSPAEDVASLSLEEVLAREVPVHWDEAVAVVEELCAALTVGGREAMVPPLGAVFIDAAGSVVVRGAARGEPGAAAAGRTLHMLLTTAIVPVPLRLFITRSTSPDAYGSVAEFAAALAYFGKPGRDDLVKALYERSVAKAPATGKQAVQAEEPAAEEYRSTKRTEKHPATLRSLRVLVGGIALVAVGAAGVLAWKGFASGPVIGSSVSTIVSEVAAGALNAIAEGNATAVRVEPAAGAGRDAARDSAAPPAGAASARPAARRTASGSPQVVARPDLSPSAAGRGSQPPARVEVAPEGLSDAVRSKELAANTAAFAPPEEAVAVGADAAIYSPQDIDVEPPVLLSGQVPTPLIIGANGGTNTIELVVSAGGTVEHVRLVDGPRRMPDMMFLSGAKMWKFRPAEKNGQPVRYRTSVSWSSVP
jgi:hypothetical protein